MRLEFARGRICSSTSGELDPPVGVWGEKYFCCGVCGYLAMPAAERSAELPPPPAEKGMYFWSCRPGGLEREYECEWEWWPLGETAESCCCSWSCCDMALDRVGSVYC
jgi:hypothetical protein